eukprot:gene3170-17449_t
MPGCATEIIEIASSFSTQKFGAVEVNSACNMQFDGGYVGVSGAPLDPLATSFTMIARLNTNLEGEYDCFFSAKQYRWGFA